MTPVKERSFLSVFFLLLLVLDLAGCGSLSQIWEDQRPLSVFYATDRARTGSSEPKSFYGSVRGPLEYGSCGVAVPPKHRIAKLEQPFLRFHPVRHFTLLQVDTLGRRRFFGELARFMENEQQKTALVFVHGYNSSFKGAILRMAQITHDLDFKGVSLVYSWPSQSSIREYRADELSVGASGYALYSFLVDLAEHSGTDGIYLLAHSMGNRALTAAFARLATERSDLLFRFKALVLAAPDIDADYFKTVVAPSITGKGVPITLYASRSDRALLFSKDLHGARRAGEVRGTPVVLSGIETIDVSEVSDDLLGHSYYGHSRPVLSDMFYIITNGIPAEKRFSLEPVDIPEGRYWKFRK